MNATLGHGVIDEIRVSRQPGNGARVDDRRSGFHLARRRLRKKEIAVKIGLDCFVKVLFGQILEIVRVQLECRIVDEDVDLAEGFDRLFGRILAKVWLSDIPRDD